MTKLAYKMPVMNREGFVIFLPSVVNKGDLLSNEDIDIYASTAAQEFPLGTKMVNGDRVWRYCVNGGSSLAIAVPVQSAARQHAEADDDVVCGAASAIGALTVEVTSTANLAVAVDYYKEGYLIVNDVVGQGQMRKIKGHPALVGTGDSTFTLYEPLEIALDTTSQLGLRKNPYDSVIATAAVLSGPALGVAQFVVTASEYFWLQSGGPAAVVPQAAIALGTYAVVGTTAAKADPSAAATTEIPIGWPMTPGVADTEQCMIFLTIDR